MSWDRAKDLPARLKATREVLGLIQEEFGELMGVTAQSISDYETGRSIPSRSRLERLAKRLGIPVAAFSTDATIPLERLRNLAGAVSDVKRALGPDTEPRGRRALRLLELKMEAAELEGRTVGRDEILEWLRLAQASREGGAAAGNDG